MGENASAGIPKAAIPTVSASYAFCFYCACITVGGKPQELLDILGAVEKDFDNPVHRFSCDSMLDMIAHTKKQTGHKSIGILSGQNFRPETFGDIGQAVIATNSLRQAHQINDKYQAIAQQFGTTKMQNDGKMVRIMWSPYIADAERLRTVTEAVFIGCVAIARWLLWDQDAEALTVRFQHKKPCEPDPYLECYGCQVLYNQPYDSLEYDAGLADIKLPQANSTILAAMKTRLDLALISMNNQNQLSNQVYQVLHSLLGNRSTNLPDVADIMGHSPQILVRRLRGEGTSFRVILQEVRRKNADYYLMEGQKTITEIALCLGYSDQSAFSRAYKLWHGKPPTLREEADLI